MNKKKLAVVLSKLKKLDHYNINLEQYQTDSELAAGILWDASLGNNIKNKTIADLGCGNGIFGIGAILLGAKKVFFVDSDKAATNLVKENLNSMKINRSRYTIINDDISGFDKKVDLVMMNPPFGVVKRHNDQYFLEKAFEISNMIISMHKIESKKFIEQLSSKHGFEVEKIKELTFGIKKIMKFHTKKIHGVKVGCWMLKRKL